MHEEHLTEIRENTHRILQNSMGVNPIQVEFNAVSYAINSVKDSHLEDPINHDTMNEIYEELSGVLDNIAEVVVERYKDVTINIWTRAPSGLIVVGFISTVFRTY